MLLFNPTIIDIKIPVILLFTAFSLVEADIVPREAAGDDVAYDDSGMFDGGESAETDTVEEPFIYGLWATTESIYTPAAAEKLIATAYTYGINAIFLQVRRAGDAYYFSDTEARSRKIVDDDFDPLGYTLKLAHSLDIEIHAWLNVNYCWPGPDFPPDAKHICNRHPEWIIVGRDSRRVTTYSRSEHKSLDSEGWYLDPAAVGFAEYFAEVCREVVEKYDVDGIHLDFIRYPNIRFGYSKEDRSRFLTTGRGQDPVIFGYEELDKNIHRPATGVYGLAERWMEYDVLEWMKWRSEQINEIVYLAATTVHAEDLNCEVTVAPWKNPEHAYRYVGQDYLRWTERGYIDAIIPMAYWGKKEQINDLSRRITNIAGEEVDVYMGLGAFNHDSPYCATITDYLLENNEDVDGVVLFDYGSCWKKPQTLPDIEAVRIANLLDISDEPDE